MSSTNHNRPTDCELAPVKFSRLTRRGVLLGLSRSQLVTVAFGGATLVGALYIGGGMLLLHRPDLGTRRRAALDTLRGSADRGVAADRQLVAVAHDRRATAVSTPDRVPRPVGTLSLPGDAARLREFRPRLRAGMLHDPHAATLTAVWGSPIPRSCCSIPSSSSVASALGRVLATVCRSGRVASLQVLERTLPDSGKGLAEWWAQHGTTTTRGRRRRYGELIDRAGPAGERHATTVTLSLDMKASAGRSGLLAAAYAAPPPCSGRRCPRCRRSALGRPLAVGLAGTGRSQ